MRFVIICAAAALAVGGCTNRAPEQGVASVSGVSAQQSADPEQPSGNPEERGRQFVSCMRANGVDLPDPEPGDQTGKTALRFEGYNLDKSELAPALEKCGKYLPGGVKVPLSPEQLEAARRLAQCIRDNGVPDWPDPDPEGHFKTEGLAAITKDNPALMPALEKCRAA